MQIKQIISNLESIFPLQYADTFDNVGLIIGDEKNIAKKALIALDVTKQVLDEAISIDCNFIISYHPVLFNSIKRINNSDIMQSLYIKAIKNNISIYSIHTALDNSYHSSDSWVSDALKINNKKKLINKKNIIKKLTTYVPLNYANDLRKSLFEAGAGDIGNYSNCSFSFQGEGTYLPEHNSNPSMGVKGELNHERETCVGVVFPFYLESKILKALFQNHPYEEVAYEVYMLENYNQNIGLGWIGSLPQAITQIEFLNMLKTKLDIPCIRHTKAGEKKIKKIAFIQGSGAFAINKAIEKGADVFVSSDFKYHDFMHLEDTILLADIGHFESEKLVSRHLFNVFKNKLPKFEFVISNLEVNPINYKV